MNATVRSPRRSDGFGRQRKPNCRPPIESPTAASSFEQFHHREGNAVGDGELEVPRREALVEREVAEEQGVGRLDRGDEEPELADDLVGDRAALEEADPGVRGQQLRRLRAAPGGERRLRSDEELRGGDVARLHEPRRDDAAHDAEHGERDDQPLEAAERGEHAPELGRLLRRRRRRPGRQRRRAGRGGHGRSGRRERDDVAGHGSESRRGESPGGSAPGRRCVGGDGRTAGADTTTLSDKGDRPPAKRNTRRPRRCSGKSRPSSAVA